MEESLTTINTYRADKSVKIQMLKSADQTILTSWHICQGQEEHIKTQQDVTYIKCFIWTTHVWFNFSFLVGLPSSDG